MRNGENTRTAILDAAENLFAAASFDIVSMRDVAAKAKVPLGLINYHFQSKEKLFEAIIARRSDELNSRRREAFAAIKGKPDLRQVLDVFLRPYLELMLEGGPGWRAYGRLLAQTGQAQRWTRLITRHFKETQDIILNALIAGRTAADQGSGGARLRASGVDHVRHFRRQRSARRDLEARL